MIWMRMIEPQRDKEKFNFHNQSTPLPYLLKSQMNLSVLLWSADIQTCTLTQTRHRHKYTDSYPFIVKCHDAYIFQFWPNKQKYGGKYATTHHLSLWSIQKYLIHYRMSQKLSKFGPFFSMSEILSNICKVKKSEITPH